MEDSDWFVDGILENRPFLLRVATALTHNKDDAEDLVQDTVARALRKRHRFQEGTNLPAWLRTMLVHLYYEGGRDKKRRREIALEERNERHDSTGNVEDDAILGMELKQALQDAGPLLRMVVEHDLSYEDAARALGIKEGTLNGRIFRARREARARRREREGDGDVTAQSDR